MVVLEHTVLALLLILLLGLIVPELFKRFRLPFVTSLILIGATFGPYGLNYVQSNEIIEFFGFLGSSFLMLMAGLEIKLKHLEKLGKKISIMAAANGIVPFVTGVGIMLFFGYPLLAAILIGTVFISSSVAVVISLVKAEKLLGKEIGQTIVSAVVLEDVFSLLMLSIILQGVSPITELPLPIYFIVLLGSVFLLKKFIPWLANYFFEKRMKKDDLYETELRFALVILMAVLLYFSGLGVHPIVAAFIVGLLLSDVVKTDVLHTKLHTLGYGMFVPVFFFIVGMQLNLSILIGFDLRNMIMVSLILGLIISKFASGYLISRWAQFSKQHSAFFGVASMAQLTTTLAVTYAASTLNILDTTITTAIIVLAILTTVVSPLLLNLINKKES
jgi:Kef-type K+ transport system membrane component KefB